MADWFIATNGTSGGAGSIGDPWDIATGLTKRTTVQPGDRVYLRGGVYQYPVRTGTIPGRWDLSLLGTAAEPVYLLPYLDEHVEIDGGIQNHVTDHPAYVIVNDLEVYVSENIDDDRISTDTTETPLDRIYGGFEFQDGTGISLRHCAVHACLTNGIGFWGRVDGGSEIYGCMIYDNGFTGTDRNHGHGIYGQNEHADTLHGDWKFIRNNICIDNWSHNIHFYGSAAALVNYIQLHQTLFGSWDRSDNGTVLIGPDGTAHDYVVTDNFGAGLPITRAGSLKIGYGAAVDDVQLTSNYVACDVTVFTGSTDVVATDTWMWANGWSGPRYFSDGLTTFTEPGIPATPQVRAYPSIYDWRRVHVGVLAFNGETAYAWDPGSLLLSGQKFELRDPRDFWGTPLQTGVYAGGTISLPLTGGSGAGTSPDHSVELDAFILLRGSLFTSQLSIAARHAACTAIAALVDAGSGPGRFRIYDDGEGAGIPASPESLPNGQILTDIQLAKPAFGAPSNGAVTGNAVAVSAVGVAGDAHYFRIADSAGTVVMQGTAGEFADTTDLTLDNKSLQLGGAVQLDFMQLLVME